MTLPRAFRYFLLLRTTQFYCQRRLKFHHYLLLSQKQGFLVLILELNRILLRKLTTIQTIIHLCVPQRKMRQLNETILHLNFQFLFIQIKRSYYPQKTQITNILEKLKLHILPTNLILSSSFEVTTILTDQQLIQLPLLQKKIWELRL